MLFRSVSQSRYRKQTEKKVNYDKKIELLVAESTTVHSAIVQAAMKQQEDEEQNRKIEKVKTELRHIDAQIETAVKDLRAIRKVEKLQKNLLKEILKAQAQFKIDADFHAYRKAVADFYKRK